jgi:hypothetical protein
MELVKNFQSGTTKPTSTKHFQALPKAKPAEDMLHCHDDGCHTSDASHDVCITWQPWGWTRAQTVQVLLLLLQHAQQLQG